MNCLSVVQERLAQGTGICCHLLRVPPELRHYSALQAKLAADPAI